MRQLRVEQGAAPHSKPGRNPAYGYAFLAFRAGDLVTLIPIAFGPVILQIRH